MSKSTNVMTAQIETITPEIAREYLGRNLHNRRLYPGIVAAYANDIKQGRWNATGAPIQFNRKGELIDGQHRLHAIIAANKPVSMFVVTNVPNDSYHYIDLNKPRTVADALTIEGTPNASRLGALARRIVDMERGYNTTFIGLGASSGRNKKGQRMATVNETLDFIKSNESELTEILQYLAPLYRGMKYFNMSKSGALLWFMQKRDRDKAREFWRQLYEGTDAVEHIAWLRNFLINTKLQKKSLHPTSEIRYVTTAWKRFIEGSEPIRRFVPMKDIWL